MRLSRKRLHKSNIRQRLGHRPHRIGERVERLACQAADMNAHRDDAAEY